MIRFRKPERDGGANVFFPALMGFWFAYFIFQLDGQMLYPFKTAAVLAISMGLVAGIAWLISTPARLKGLRLNRWWMLPLAAPFAVALLASWRGLSVVCWVSLIVASLAQWLLAFMAPQDGVPRTQMHSPGDQRA